MFSKYKIVKYWYTPTEFSIRIYKRMIPLLPFWEYERWEQSVESAEKTIAEWKNERKVQREYYASIPKPTVEKRL